VKHIASQRKTNRQPFSIFEDGCLLYTLFLHEKLYFKAYREGDYIAQPKPKTHT